MRVVVGGQPAAPRAPAPARAGIVRSFIAGWGAAVSMPLVLGLVWVVSLIFAAVMALPYAVLLRDHVGHSVVGQEEFAVVGIDTFVEFGYAYERELNAALLVVVPGAIAYALVSLFLSGGVVDRLCHGRPRPWTVFFATCTRHFWPFCFLALCAAALFGALVVLPLQGLARLVDATLNEATSPEVSFDLTWIRWGVALLLASWVARVYDYARLALVLEPNRGVLRALGRGVRVNLRYGIRTFVLWLALVLAPVAAVYPYMSARTVVGMNGPAAMWTALALGQALVLVRILGRFARLGGQLRLLQGLP